MTDSDSDFGPPVTRFILDNGLLGITDRSDQYVWRMCHLRISSFTILNKDVVKGEGDSDLVRISVCMHKNHGRSLSTPAFNAFPPPLPTATQQIGKAMFTGGSTAATTVTNGQQTGAVTGAGGQQNPSQAMDLKFSFRYLHTFRDNVDIVLIRLQRVSKRGRHPTVANAPIYLSDIMQFPLDDDIILSMKKDKAKIAVAKVHVLAGTYPESITSYGNAQDYEFDLLPEGQNLLSSDEEDDADDENDDDMAGGHNSPKLARIIPWRSNTNAPGSLSPIISAAPPKKTVAPLEVSSSDEDVFNVCSPDDPSTPTPAAPLESSKKKAANTKKAKDKADKEREKAEKEREKAEKEREKAKKEQEKKEREKEKKEREKAKKEQEREEKEKKKQGKTKVKGSTLGANQFFVDTSSSESENEASDETGGNAHGLDVQPPNSQQSVPAYVSSLPTTGRRSFSLIPSADDDLILQDGLQRDAELQKRAEYFERVIGDASRVILYDAQRRRSRRLEQIYVGSDTSSGLVAISTKSNQDIAAIMSVLFERRDDATHVVIAGSDRFINDILRPYLELCLNISLNAEPVLFYILPLGKSTDVARQIAAQDPDYSALFFDEKWTQIFEEREALTSEEAALVRRRIQKYLDEGTHVRNFDIGEVRLTMSDNTSKPWPFIKTVNVTPMKEGDEVRDTAIDYYTLKKKGDHEQRHNDKMTMQLLVTTMLPYIVRNSFNCDKESLYPTMNTMTMLIISRKKPNRVVQVLKIGVAHKKSTATHEEATSSPDGQRTRSRGGYDDLSLSPTSAGENPFALSSTNTGSTPSGTTGGGSSSTSTSETKSEHSIVLVSRLLLSCESSSSDANGPFNVHVDGVHFANVKTLSIKTNWRTARSFRIHTFH